jgi:hypothetical protein
MGDPLDADFAPQYGYALQLLCGHLGELIPPDFWGGVPWGLPEEVGLGHLLNRTGPPVPVPRSRDFPIIGHWTAAEIAAKVAELGDSHLTSDEEELQELVDEYEGWLRTAAAKGKAIVFFYH